MKIVEDKIYLSASDLSTHIACPHATFLNLQEAKGSLKAPGNIHAALYALQKKGEEFERNYLEQLKAKGKTVIEIEKTSLKKALQDTVSAMAEGADIIYQARLEHDIWNGWADFLVKTNKPGRFDWSYEVMDTKLSRETKAGAILQICLYSEILSQLQGRMPEYMCINNPNGEHRFRVDDFMAFYRIMKNKLQQAILVPNNGYPDPVPHCDICKWWELCNQRRRADDHLSFIAGMGKLQTQEVKEHEVTTLESMAGLHTGISWKPKRGSVDTYKRLAHQADLQLKWRTTNSPTVEILPPEADFGFFKLPEPSPHDIFFDFEGDPFVGTMGLEYLFGWLYRDKYYDLWANNELEEKQALEKFMDTVMKVLDADPGMHIYHFGAYEQSALKRLVGKYAIKEDELDRLLRAGVFVNLHSITRRAIIAGVESYSLKDLEKLHGYLRIVDLRTVAAHKLLYEGLLESGSIQDADEQTISIVRDYNKDDCISTKYLRDWLEEQRAKLISQGTTIPRPARGDGEASENITEHQQRIQPLFDELVKDVPVEKETRTTEQQAKWLLANMLDWYRREKKSFWWEVFRLQDLTDEELLEERDALSGLTFTGKREKVKRSFVDYYTFPDQETTLSEGNRVRFSGEEIGTIHSIDFDKRIVGIKKSQTTLEIHPTHLICTDFISDKPKEEALIRFAQRVIQNGIDSDGSCRAGRDLLLRKIPRMRDTMPSIEIAQERAIEWVHKLNDGVLPIQGPPGTGKSYNAARMILSLVKTNKKIGVTALSHKVIDGLLKKVIKEAANKNMMVRIVQKVTEDPDTSDPKWIQTKDNNEVIESLNKGYQIAAGTSFMWARENFFEAVDYLFVDEAGQLSLIDTVALSHAGRNLVLLGDPQQLKQPQKGSHPEGTELSALEHILQGEKTIRQEQGVFLDKTWRMHPAINSFISELFYDCKLHPLEHNEQQTLEGNTKFKKPGIYFEPVIHRGNQNSSSEEVERVKQIVDELLNSQLIWINRRAEREPLTAENIKIISPYNAQVNALHRSLPEIQIGTVDKFQGQEAAVIILSMATSTPEDAPRGMEFLYSLNRLNVAVSRAKGVFILVASPSLFEPECRSPHQMQLANALCRLKEFADS
ncbi:MAG: TM0106 family RecB-like putative nuclease [Bacteroidetes bacterium]|nr:MAG: TM0106 family RecB-like putative nuclease [Bacteroidota bacterium]